MTGAQSASNAFKVRAIARCVATRRRRARARARRARSTRDAAFGANSNRN
jgi:hypothetical protein